MKEQTYAQTYKPAEEAKGRLSNEKASGSGALYQEDPVQINSTQAGSAEPAPDIFASEPYRRTRTAYIIQCALEYFISLMVIDDFLAKLLHDIGMTDGTVGLLSSLISFTLLFQLAAIPLSARLKTAGKPVTLIHFSSMLTFSLLYAVPFLPLSVRGKTAAAAVILLLGYLLQYLCSSICYLWGNSFVAPDHRGRFGARKEIISLLSGIGFILVMSQMSDRLEAAGRLHTAFLIIGAAMLLISAGDLVTLLRFEDMKLDRGDRYSLQEIRQHVLARPAFRRVVILVTGFDVARFLSVGFMGTYKAVDLGFSLGVIQLMNIGACLLRAGISQPLGRYTDRKGRDKGYYLGCAVLLGAFLCGAAASPACRYMIIPYALLLQANYAGTVQNTSNLLYSSVEEAYILPALLIGNSIRGVAGFGAAYVGRSILNAVQASGNLIGGRTIYGQQLLCGLSALLVLSTMAYNRKVLGRTQLRLN